MLKLFIAVFVLLVSLAITNSNGSEPVPYTQTAVAGSQVECLAKNMYFEAKNEPTEGIIAVGFVTMNRVKDKHFPKSICDVVYQKVNETCQFSWVCEKGINPAITNSEKFHKIYKLAYNIASNYDSLKENDHDPSKGSLFFHATYINPGWNLHRVIVIGQHIFYKRKSNDKRP